MKTRNEVNLQEVEIEARKNWDKSPDIKAEFGEIGTYVAYCLAEARGVVGISPKISVRGEQHV